MKSSPYLWSPFFFRVKRNDVKFRTPELTTIYINNRYYHFQVKTRHYKKSLIISIQLLINLILHYFENKGNCTDLYKKSGSQSDNFPKELNIFDIIIYI